MVYVGVNRSEQLMYFEWTDSRTVWLQGWHGGGKSESLARMVADFEERGGEALVFSEDENEATAFSAKLLVTTSTRDALAALEEACASRLSGQNQAPLLLAVEHINDLDRMAPEEFSPVFVERIVQVMRHAQELSAWVIITSRVDSQLLSFLRAVLTELADPILVLDCAQYLSDSAEQLHFHSLTRLERASS